MVVWYGGGGGGVGSGVRPAVVVGDEAHGVAVAETPEVDVSLAQHHLVQLVSNLTGW